MANKAIPDLTDASALTGAELVHIVQGGNSRKVSLTALAAILSGLSNAQNWAMPFRGATVRRAAASTPAAFPFAYPWDVADIDSDGFWSNTQPTRFTIPTGVTKVRLNCCIDLGSLSEASGLFLSFRKNGDEFAAAGGGAISVRQGSTGYPNNVLSLASGVISVAAGDYFEARVNYSGSNAALRTLAANGYNFFSIEVIETTGSVGVPMYAKATRLGALVNSETLSLEVAAQPYRVPVAAAGSRAYAATAPSASTVLSVRKNGVEFGTITFASGSNAGTFAVATATSFVAGDVLSIVAPAAVNGMADLSVLLKQVIQ